MTPFIPTAPAGIGGAVAMPGLEIPDRILPELIWAHALHRMTGLILTGARQLSPGVLGTGFPARRRCTYDQEALPAPPAMEVRG